MFNASGHLDSNDPRRARLLVLTLAAAAAVGGVWLWRRNRSFYRTVWPLTNCTDTSSISVKATASAAKPAEPTEQDSDEQSAEPASLPTLFEGGSLSYEDYVAHQAAASDNDRIRRLRKLHAAGLAYAHAVYGGPLGAARAGCVTPPPEKMVSHTDFKLFHDYVLQLKRLLHSDSIQQEGSPCQQRLLFLVSAMRGLLSPALRENTRMLREVRFESITTLEALEALGEPTLQTSSENSEYSHDSERADSEGSEESRDCQRRALRSVDLSMQQIAAVISGRAKVRQDIQQLGAERKQLVKQLQQYALGNVTDPSVGTICARRLRANLEEEGLAMHSYHTWFLCHMLSPLQHAKADVAAQPHIPDPLTLGDMLAATEERRSQRQQAMQQRLRTASANLNF